MILLILATLIMTALSSDEGTCSAETCAPKSVPEFSSTRDGWKMPTALFEQNLEEVAPQEQEVIFGKLPEWLNGKLYRVGPGMFEKGGRKVRNLVDGLSKVHMWSFNGAAAPTFAASFLKSDIYNRTMAAGELVPYKHLDKFDPPLTKLEKAKVMFWDDEPDNNNIAPWNLASKGVTICNESPIYIDIDRESLEFQRKFVAKSSDYKRFVKEAFSASHFARHPSGDSINYKFVIPMDGGVFSGVKKPAYHLYRYTETESGDVLANFVGDVPIEGMDIRGIHSLGATENFAILPRFALYFELSDPVEIGTGAKIGPHKETFFDVVSLVDGTRTQFKFPSHNAMHIINSFERKNEAGQTEVVIDWPTIDSVEGIKNSNIFELLNRETLTDPNYSYEEHFPHYTKFTLRRFTLNMETGEGTQYDYPRMWSPDAIEVEFPYINDNYRGLPYCYAYFQTWNHDAHNAMGLLKVDMCKETSVGWERKNKFPVEPVFAARPGGEGEDDGVVLAPVFDADTGRSELYVWDAKSLEVVAIVNTPIVVPYSLHGTWIPE